MEGQEGGAGSVNSSSSELAITADNASSGDDGQHRQSRREPPSTIVNLDEHRVHRQKQRELPDPLAGNDGAAGPLTKSDVAAGTTDSTMKARIAGSDDTRGSSFLSVGAMGPAKSNDGISSSKAVMADPRRLGSKAAPGTFHTIVNQMPPHRVYIEPFFGWGAVMKAKLPADRNIGIDLDGDRISAGLLEQPSAELTRGDGIAFLERFKWAGGELVYCDPPYLLETRKSAHRYRFEISHHQRLLDVLQRLPCYVMLSGYFSELYAQTLSTWRVVSWEAMTRGGTKATEYLWCNFPEPLELHDYRYLGRNFRERERIKRKKQRWANKLQQMPALERHALFAAIKEVYDRNPRQK